VYLLVSLHLVSTWVSIGCGILVTLGGCRAPRRLGGSGGVVARVVLVLGHLPVFL
jgi:hypothetical protein